MGIKTCIVDREVHLSMFSLAKIRLILNREIMDENMKKMVEEGKRLFDPKQSAT